MNKELVYRDLSDLARKQNCFNDMFVTSFTERLEVEIYDDYSYFKIANLLPSISSSTLSSSYSYDRKSNKWYFACEWADEEMIEKFVQVIHLIVETCMVYQSEFEKTFQTIWKILR